MQPPLLNRPGMGAKLVTYYRKRGASDTDHQKLKQGEPPAMSVYEWPVKVTVLWSVQLFADSCWLPCMS
jgi:hypothetical protein